MAPHKYSQYPKALFVGLAVAQIIASTIVALGWYFTWSQIKNSPVLIMNLGTVEAGTAVPNEWHAPWFFKLLHATAHVAVAANITALSLHFCGRLFSPINLVVNFSILFLHIAGVAGVAAFTFLLHLNSKCHDSNACISYKVAFMTAHVSGLIAWAQMLLDAYTWGRVSTGAVAYRHISDDVRTASFGAAYAPYSG